MRVVACLVAVAWVACSFSDPDLSQTQFRCANDRACPSEQVCRSGTCVVTSHDGLACTTACAAGEQCCDDSINPPQCIPGSEACLGTTAYCDGVEDCASGSRCCQSGTVQACSADESCGVFACQDASDCPSRAPNCCIEAGEPKPWKICTLFPC